jgi:hypothetical protein
MPITPGGSQHIRGHRKLALLHDLAAGDLTVAAIAQKYDRTESTIYSIKSNNAEQIDAIRADHANEFAGLWVASKVNRVAEYQADIEDEDLDVQVKHKALRAVAEELGQLTTKQEIQASVTYQIEGVDPEAMK